MCGVKHGHSSRHCRLATTVDQKGSIDLTILLVDLTILLVLCIFETGLPMVVLNLWTEMILLLRWPPE